MGFPGFEVSYFEINGTRNFINSGVILINLKMLRSVNASLIQFFIIEYHSYLLNMVFHILKTQLLLII